MDESVMMMMMILIIIIIIMMMMMLMMMMSVTIEYNVVPVYKRMMCGIQVHQ